MTREEAIKEFKDYLSRCDAMDSNFLDAIYMAIEALSSNMDGDLISRKDALNLSCIITGQKGDAEIIKKCFEAYRDHIASLPLAEPKMGEWIFEETDEYKRTYCSVCGISAPFVCVSDNYYGRRVHGETRKTKFCPNCGARMLER